MENTHDTLFLFQFADVHKMFTVYFGADSKYKVTHTGALLLATSRDGYQFCSMLWNCYSICHIHTISTNKIQKLKQIFDLCCLKFSITQCKDHMNFIFCVWGESL